MGHTVRPRDGGGFLSSLPAPRVQDTAGFPRCRRDWCHDKLLWQSLRGDRIKTRAYILLNYVNIIKHKSLLAFADAVPFPFPLGSRSVPCLPFPGTTHKHIWGLLSSLSESAACMLSVSGTTAPALPDQRPGPGCRARSHACHLSLNPRDPS